MYDVHHKSQQPTQDFVTTLSHTIQLQFQLQLQLQLQTTTILFDSLRYNV